MKWWETFLIRSAPGLEQKIENQLLELIAELPKGPGCSGLIEAEAGRHTSLSNDFVFRLVWNSDPPLPEGSRVGQGLRAEFKKYGLVVYEVWRQI